MPTKNYSYGVVFRGATRPEPLPLIDFYVAEGTKYYNTLVEVENGRRAACRQLMADTFPEYAAAASAHAEAEAAVEAAYEVIRAAKAQSRSNAVPEPLAAALTEATARRNAAAPAEQKIRKACWKDAGFLAATKQIDAASKVAAKAARTATPIHWGTYQQIEEAFKAACQKVKGGPLRFKRRTGEGTVSCHFQGTAVTWADAVAGGDSRLQVARTPDSKSWTARFWAHSPERGKAEYVTVPFVMHRPLPDGAEIKWLKLHRRLIGTQFRYDLQFTVKYPEPEPRYRPPGTFAVNYGWRLHPSGCLRVAYWVGSDGDHGEVLIPADRVARHRASRGVQADRDARFNVVRDQVLAYLATCASRPHLDRLQHLARWRSPIGLRHAYYWWRDNRTPGDDAVVEILREYARTEMRLHDRQANAVDNYEQWRRDFYRNWAAEMSAWYGAVVIADTDWSDIQENKGDESDHWKEYRTAAAVSILSLALKERFAGDCHRAAAKDTTQRCHSCGHVHRGVGAKITHRCERCALPWDIDRNNATNLLRTAGQWNVQEPAVGAK